MARFLPMARFLRNLVPLRGFATTVFATKVFATTVLATTVLGAPAPLAAQDSQGHAGRWLEVRTEHLTLLTDAPPDTGRALALQLERFRAAFARLAPELELASPAPTRILAFSSYEDHRIGPEGGGVRVLGQFSSSPDGNFITLSASPEDEERALGVVQHEFVHYLVRHNFPRVPLWFNEGLAEYYRTFAVEDGHAVVGRPPPDRLRWLERSLELDLDAVLTATSEGLPRHGHGGGAEELGRLYAEGWALVHFLLSGDPGHLDATAAYLALLAAGDEPRDAFEEAFGVRLGTLERQLADYLREGLQRADFPTARIPLARLTVGEPTQRWMTSPEVDTVLGDLAARLGRPDTARRHYLDALENEPGFADALAGLAHLEDRAGSLGEAALLWRDAAAAGMGPVGRLRHGRHLLNRAAAAGDREEGRRLAAEARAVLGELVTQEPHFAEARVLLGRAILTGAVLAADDGAEGRDGDLRTGIRHLRKARALLPLRMDVVALLVQLQVQAGDFAAARAQVEVLRRWAEPELARRAQEAVERGALVAAANAALDEGDVPRAVRLFDEAIEVTRDPALRQRMEVQLRELQRRH